VGDAVAEVCQLGRRRAGVYLDTLWKDVVVIDKIHKRRFLEPSAEPIEFGEDERVLWFAFLARGGFRGDVGYCRVRWKECALV
jgi:hypothetical protein